MIQRKQTLYLLAALIVTIVCLCLPIASLKASGMEPDSIVTNLWIRSNAGISFFVSPLFALLLLTCPLTLWAIFKYHQRLFQVKLCVINMILSFFGMLILHFSISHQRHPSLFALPFVCPLLRFSFIIWRVMPFLQMKN